MATERPNVSGDLLWEITRSQNAFLVKRRSAGGAQFSRDPLNLPSQHSRKHAGYANSKAIGVQETGNGGITLISKVVNNPQQPAQNIRTVTWGRNASNRKIYKSIANIAAKNGYRADLRQAVVARASTIRKSQREKRDIPETKLRGAKARRAAEGV